MLRDYLGNYIAGANVKTYGAYGDGLHDDSNAIITALQNNKVVYVPSGTYLVTKTINIPNDTMLFGDGDNSIIYLSGTFSMDVIPWRNETHHANMRPIVRTGSNCRLESFKVHGDLTEARDELHVGILISGNNTQCHNITTENINYSEEAWAYWQQHGPSGYKSGYGEVAYCPGFGVYVFNADNAIIKNSKFINSGYEALGTENAKNIVADSCYCYNANACSYQIHKGSKHICFSNCIADGTNANHGSNFVLHGYPNDGMLEDIVISNCVLKGVSSFPVNSVWGFDKNVIITGCVINVTGTGILIHASKMTGSDQVIGDSAKNYIITNNMIHATGNGIVYNGDICTITGNLIEYGGESGITAMGENTEISGNLLMQFVA